MQQVSDIRLIQFPRSVCCSAASGIASLTLQPSQPGLLVNRQGKPNARGSDVLGNRNWNRGGRPRIGTHLLNCTVRRQRLQAFGPFVVIDSWINGRRRRRSA